MKPFSVLVGNGINNIGNDNSWDNLINRISEFCKINIVIDNEKKKHFPLLYEEIFLHSARAGNIKEIDLKRFIAKNVSVIKSNRIHERLRQLPVENIITTNYEFSIEGSIPKKNEGIITEKLYSIFRHYKTDTKRVWHIHGDCLHPGSINLGFEHYGGQLQNIRNYTATVTNYQSKKVSKIPLIKRLEMQKVRNYSWIDLFFTMDIHIIGLTFDFVESDLWWLLTFRARKKIEKKNLIRNEITYYIPKKFASGVKNKLDLFRATDVNVVMIDKTGESFYDEILTALEQSK